MKMRLIDADALHKTKIVERKQIFVDGKRRVTNLYTEVVMSVHVENAPTIDPESMRGQGEWEDEYGGQFENPRYRCSVCKEKALFKIDRDCLGGWHEIQALTPSCPICGAKMKVRDQA